MTTKKRQPIVIAIDGPSASGKSTNARMVAKILNYLHVDTGAMYRTLGWYCLKNGIDVNDSLAVTKACRRWKATLQSSEGQVRLVVDPGMNYDLHCTAPGKLYLAYCPEPERDSLLAKLEFTPHTAATIGDAKALLKEVTTVRTQGHAFDLGEGYEGIQCVSAPVFDRNGMTVAMLTISGTTGNVPVSRLQKLVPIIKMYADRISKRLL